MREVKAGTMLSKILIRLGWVNFQDGGLRAVRDVRLHQLVSERLTVVDCGDHVAVQATVLLTRKGAGLLERACRA